MEGTHFTVSQDNDNNFTCALLAAQSGKEPVPYPAGAGGRLGGGTWGGRQLELRGGEGRPLSGRRYFSSFLRPKVLGLAGRWDPVWGKSGEDKAQSEEPQGSFELPGQALASPSASQGLSSLPQMLMSVVPIHV